MYRVLILFLWLLAILPFIFMWLATRGKIKKNPEVTHHTNYAAHVDPTSERGKIILVYAVPQLDGRGIIGATGSGPIVEGDKAGRFIKNLEVALAENHLAYDVFLDDTFGDEIDLAKMKVDLIIIAPIVTKMVDKKLLKTDYIEISYNDYMENQVKSVIERLKQNVSINKEGAVII